MKKKEEFVSAILKSTKHSENIIEYASDKLYYCNQYAQPIVNYFKERQTKSYETTPSKKNDLISICSLASSARICFLDFASRKNVMFEVPLYNDISKSRPSKIDAVIGDTYYECKCQEVIDGEKETFSKSYNKSKLFLEFGIGNIIIEEVERTRKGIKKLEYILKFSMKDFDVDIDANYSQLKFNVKQLICHLIALANSESGKEKVLQYVIYKPSKRIIEESDKLTELYDTLQHEIDAIWKSRKISYFCERHSIILPLPEERYINEIPDFVFCEAFQKCN